MTSRYGCGPIARSGAGRGAGRVHPEFALLAVVAALAALLIAGTVPSPRRLPPQSGVGLEHTPVALSLGDRSVVALSQFGHHRLPTLDVCARRDAVSLVH